MIKKSMMLLSVLSLVSWHSWAGTVTTTTTTLPKPGNVKAAEQPLQKTAQEAMGQNSNDMMTTIMMAGGFAYAAHLYCAKKEWPNCALFTAAAGLGGAVVASIMKPKNKNQQMYDAVTVGTSSPCGSACPPNTSTMDNTQNSGGPGMDGAGNAKWAGYQSTMKKLKDIGVTVDKKGVVTMPDGSKKNLGDMSASSLQAAGYSSQAIADFNSKAADIKAKAGAAAKSTDGSDSFGDSVGGGGASANSTAAAVVPYGIPASGLATGPGMGVDRNPAQIAGMSRDLNGEPIGVSADNMWLMMNRRYNLMEKNGSFLAPGP